MLTNQYTCGAIGFRLAGVSFSRIWVRMYFHERALHLRAAPATRARRRALGCLERGAKTPHRTAGPRSEKTVLGSQVARGSGARLRVPVLGGLLLGGLLLGGLILGGLRHRAIFGDDDPILGNARFPIRRLLRRRRRRRGPRQKFAPPAGRRLRTERSSAAEPRDARHGREKPG